MRRLRGWMMRIAGLFNREAKDRELNEELGSHLQLHIEDNLRSGMTLEEAQRQAKIQLGAIESIKEAYRDQRGLPVLETLIQDLRFGARMLAKAPGFTAIAVLTLALGVGVSTALYSVVNGVLLHPIPGAEPDRLVSIELCAYDGAERRSGGVTAPALDILLAGPTPFSQLAWWRNLELDLRTEEGLDELTGTAVSPNFFDVWGVLPVFGRTFARDEKTTFSSEGVPEGDTKIVLSHTLWRSLFGGDPEVLGKSIELSGRHFTVIGVMPSYFRFPWGSHTKFWVPAEPPRWPTGRSPDANISVLARLKTGTTFQQAQALLDVTGWRLGLEAVPNKTWVVGKEWNPKKRLGFAVQPVLSMFGDTDLQRTLFCFLGAVGFFLLIACANIANLTLARTEQRQQELAVRAALGAGRGRLARQVLTESLLLAGLGGLVGLCLTPLCLGVMTSLIPQQTVRIRAVGVDGHALGFAVLVCLATGLIFGLAPARHAGGTRLAEALKQAGSRGTAGTAGGRYRGKLVVLEVALTLVLLVGAGLMVQSLVRMLRLNPGFDPKNLMVTKLFLPWQRYQPDNTSNGSRSASSDATCDAVFAQIHDRLAAAPGLEGISFLRPVGRGEYLIEGQSAPVELGCLACGVGATDLFRVQRIPLLAGRLLTTGDGRTDLGGVVINESMARHLWPGQNAVGKRFRSTPGAGDSEAYEVVGVVADTYDRPSGVFYVPDSPAAHWKRSPRYFETLYVRTKAEPSRFIPLLNKEIKAVEPSMRAPEFGLCSRALEESTQGQRTYLAYLMAFAAAALLVSAIGIYGVLSYSVAQRTPEIGIRMALGAGRGKMLGLVLGEGVRLIGGGVAVGLLAAFWLTRLLRSQLYEVSPTDPAALLCGVFVVVGVGLLACLAPAVRATRIDPMTALRQP